MYKLKLTNLQQEILRFLFINPEKSFNARAIAISLEVSQPAVSKALPLLKKEGFIKVEKDKESKRMSIMLCNDKPEVVGLKRADNLKQIYESGLVQYLYDALPGATIILFGSYGLGEDITTSDIDLAAINIKEKNLDLSKFQSTLQREIIINYYPSFLSIHEHLLNNILNGIVLAGGVEL